MAWIELHDDLREKKKTYRLAKRLKISNAHACGLLCCLWTWALTAALDGDITDFSERDIANAAGWEKSPQEFYRALLDGWIDLDGEKAYIHDWDDYTQSYQDMIQQREKWKDQKRRQRGRKREDSPHECPPDSPPDKIQDSPRDTRWTVRENVRPLYHNHDEEDNINNSAHARDDFFLFDRWESTFKKMPNDDEISKIAEWRKSNGDDLIAYAMYHAGISHASSPVRYIQTCLDDWNSRGFKDAGEVQIAEDEIKGVL